MSVYSMVKTAGSGVVTDADEPTGALEVSEAPSISTTQTSYYELSGKAALMRSQMSFLASDVTAVHRDLGRRSLDEAAQALQGLAVTDLLSRLSNLGFSWRDIARMSQVSVPAVQKWRKGEPTTGANRKRLALLNALFEQISDIHLTVDPAAWAEMPIVTGCPLTRIDLIAGSREDLALELVSTHISPEDALTEFEPNWREKYRSDFKVVRASDGVLSIVSKDANDPD
jgi:hypothetical protein